MRHQVGGKLSPEYRAWANMLTRCRNLRTRNWAYYGARGITVCDRWKTFENFLADMGRRPSHEHSLDRIDNAKGYFPGNVRWATRKEQANNKSNNRLITFQGETLTQAQWAEKRGIDSKTLHQRLANGWSIGRALSQPVKQYREAAA
jgi:hypothetical protein